jgi:hypothetical protein
MAEGKKSRKYDRNRPWCQSYRNSGRRERNKVLKILRHIKRYGATDHIAVGVYNRLPMQGKPADARQITPVKSTAKRIPPHVAMGRNRPTLRMLGPATN